METETVSLEYATVFQDFWDLTARELPVQCSAVVTASTPVVAASAIVGGKALSVMFQPTSALISIVEGMAFVLWEPASAILVIKVTIVRKWTA